MERRWIPPTILALVFLAVLIVVVSTGGGGGESDNGGFRLKTTPTVATATPKPKPKVPAVDPALEPFRFIPTNASLVGAVETDPGAPGIKAAEALAGKLPQSFDGQSSSGGVDPIGSLLGTSNGQTAGGGLLGNPLYVWCQSRCDGRGSYAAWVAKSAGALDSLVATAAQSGDLSTEGTYKQAKLYSVTSAGENVVPSHLAVRGSLVIGGPNKTAVRGLLDRRGANADHLTARVFRQRVAALPAQARGPAALAQITTTAANIRKAIAGPKFAGVQLPWLNAIQGGALAVMPVAGGIKAPFAVSTDATALGVSNLPVAAGPSAPTEAAPSGSQLVAAIRDPRRTLNFLRQVGQARGIDAIGQLDQVLDAVRKYAGIDVQDDILDNLSGSATVVTTPTFSPLSVRSELADSGTAEDAVGRLNRLSTASSVGSTFGYDGPGGYGVDDEGNGVYAITKDGNDVLRIGVINDVLVATTDSDVDLDALANAPERQLPPDGGALHLDLSAAALRDTLGSGTLPGFVTQALGSVQDVRVAVRSERSGLKGEIALPVGAS